MNGKLPISLLCVAALAFACGPRPRNEASGSARVRSGEIAAARNADGSPLTPSLDVSVGRGVRFAFEIVNESSRKLEVRFPNGLTHDVVVLDSVGREVWRWSEGRLFTQAMQNRVLRSSDSLRYVQAWTDPRPGRYVAVATLASANYPVERRVEFQVER
jgi:hypothetical protein